MKDFTIQLPLDPLLNLLWEAAVKAHQEGSPQGGDLTHADKCAILSTLLEAEPQAPEGY